MKTTKCPMCKTPIETPVPGRYECRKCTTVFPVAAPRRTFSTLIALVLGIFIGLPVLVGIFAVAFVSDGTEISAEAKRRSESRQANLAAERDRKAAAAKTNVIVSNPPKKDELQESIDVATMIDKAQSEIKNRLKSPSSAKFPGVVFGRHEYDVQRMPDGTFLVFSWVDSQNTFGAMIRSKWMVEFKRSKTEFETLRVIIE